MSADGEAPKLTLRQRAIAAARAHQAAEVQDVEKRAANDRQFAINRLQRFLREWHKEATEPVWSEADGRPEVVVDGLLFTLHKSVAWHGWSDASVVAMLPCPRCSKPVPCHNVLYLNRLGDLLEGRQEIEHRDCPAIPPVREPAEEETPAPAPRTTAEELLDVLERFITERTPVSSA